MASDAKLQYGKLLFNQKNFDLALNQFDSYVQESTSSVRVAEALYSAGMTLYNQAYYTSYCAMGKQLIDGYRYSPLRSQAYLKTGRQTRFGLGQFDQAIASYQSLAANYPNTPEAQEAQFQIIQCYYNKGDLRSAYQQFSAFKNNYAADDRIRGVCENLLSAYQGQAGASSTLHSAELSDLLRSCQGSARRPPSCGNAARTSLTRRKRHGGPEIFPAHHALVSE